jgi:hypothetical protein
MISTVGAAAVVPAFSHRTFCAEPPEHGVVLALENYDDFNTTGPAGNPTHASRI